MLDRSHRLQEAPHGNLVTMLSNNASLAETLPQANILIGAVLVAGAHPGGGDQAYDRADAARRCRYQRLHRPGRMYRDLSTGPPQRSAMFGEWGDALLCGEHAASQAYAFASYPYLAALAAQGIKEAAKHEQAKALGVNTYRGHITCPGVAEALGQPVAPLHTLFKLDI